MGLDGYDWACRVGTVANAIRPASAGSRIVLFTFLSLLQTGEHELPGAPAVLDLGRLHGFRRASDYANSMSPPNGLFARSAAQCPPIILRCETAQGLNPEAPFPWIST